MRKESKQKSVGPGKGLRAWEYGLERGSVAFALIFCFFCIKTKEGTAQRLK
jgi:hypothetical protein